MKRLQGSLWARSSQRAKTCLAFKYKWYRLQRTVTMLLSIICNKVSRQGSEWMEICRKYSPKDWNSPCGDWELEEKSDVVIGMDMESWVVENEVWLDLSSSRPDQESLVLGHSSKKGRRDWPSCFTGSPEAKSLWKNECWGYSFCNTELSLDFDAGNEATLDGIRGHVLSSGESIWRFLLLPDASEKKLCSPTSGLIPWRYLYVPIGK